MALINSALLRAYVAIGDMKARLHRDERGQDLLEYALFGGLLAILIMTAAAILILAEQGGTGPLSTMFGGISGCIDFQQGTPCDPF